MSHLRALAALKISAIMLLTCALFSSGATAQSGAPAMLDSTHLQSEQAAQVDALMTPWTGGESPGAALLVVRDGRVLLEKGYGLADVEAHESITPRTVFDLASVSKQFTAMALLLLVQRGRLSLSDPLSKFLPEFPLYARNITLRHLLGHTSGLPDYPKLLVGSGKIDAGWQREWKAGAFQPTTKEIVALLAAQKEPDFAAGERWAYSNSNYVVLASVIERASGQSFPRFLRENIFGPLGMKRSFVAEGSKQVAQNEVRRATRYDRAGPGYRVIEGTPFDLIYGDGNVHSTLEDLQKWNEALYTERLVKAELLKQAFAPGRLNSGAATDYGFGWVLDQYFGLRMAYHEGGGTGFNSFVMRVPEQHFTVVVLSNFARFNPFLVGRRLARIYLADKLQLPVAVKVQPEVLRRYVGLYQLTPLLRASVTLEEGALRAEVPGQQKMKLLPLAENRFFVEGQEDTLVTFHTTTDGAVTGITVLQVDLPINGKRIAAPAPQ